MDRPGRYTGYALDLQSGINQSAPESVDREQMERFSTTTLPPFTFKIFIAVPSIDKRFRAAH